MASASLILTGALTMALLGPPEPVIAPTQPLPGEPAIAPADVAGERADASEPAPTEVAPTEQPDALPGWQDAPNPSVEPTVEPSPTGEPNDGTPIADWRSPDDPIPVVSPIPEEDPGPSKGWGLVGAAGGLFGGIVLTQLITGLTCDDVYCGTRGTGWRLFGLGAIGLAGGGGWVHGNRVAWERAGSRSARPLPTTALRASGWTMFVLGLGGLITDTVLYSLCYDNQTGPYIDIEGFRYTCSPVLSVVTLDVSTLVSATGLGLALAGESQRRGGRALELGFAPWGGRGQAGVSVTGRF